MGAPRGTMGAMELQVTWGSALGGPACLRGALGERGSEPGQLWDVLRALSVRDRRKLRGVGGQERMGAQRL